MAMTVKRFPRAPRSLLSLRRSRILAVVFTVLAFSICFGEEASHAGSRAESTFYPAFGNAGDVVVAETGDVLVSIWSPFTTNPGIQIFSPTHNFANPCGGENIIKLDAPIVSAFGMALNQDRSRRGRSTKQGIAVAVEQSGVAFLLADLSTCARESLVVAQEPVEQRAPGSFALALTPERWPEYAFVANEYGILKNKSNFVGTVGIIRIARSIRGEFRSSTGPIPSNAYIYVPGTIATPGITMSRDGNRLYVVNEVTFHGKYPQDSRYANNDYSNPTNINNGDLATDSCIPGYPTRTNATNNGVLTIIDVGKAKRGWGQRSIIQTIASGCSPVRVVETADGQYIFVATRGGNPADSDSTTAPEAGSLGRILVFDVLKLQSRDLNTVNDALVNVIKDSGGTAPVGIALFEEDQRLAVANSNRFTDGTLGTTSVAIIDISDPSAVREPEVTCKSSNIFSFPRGVTSPGSSVYVANFGNSLENVSGALQVITTSEDSTSSCMVGPYPRAQN